jgi:hypothetical protein
MKTRIFFIVIGAIILIGIGAAMFANKGVNFNGAVSGNGSQTLAPKTAFAQCLTDKGVKFYGAFWCSHCQAQKKLFGAQAIKKISYIECSTVDGKNQTQECKDAGIKSYPTWRFADGTENVGEMSFAQLSEKSGCTVPTE